MDDQSSKVKALLLPADGSEIKLVSYSVKERDSEDGDEDGKADFYDRIPDLRSWMGDAFRQRAMATFYVGANEQCNCDPVNRAFIKSNDPASYGRYCLYYTLASTLPLNETCKRLIGVLPTPDRLFWRGDVLLVRYEGELGFGHGYLDVADAVLPAIETVLKRVHASRGLERVAEDDKPFKLEMEKWRLRSPAFHKAVETGALEKFRTGQPLDNEEAQLINQISNTTIEWPDSSRELVWSRQA